jgi:hypothetical protein
MGLANASFRFLRGSASRTVILSWLPGGSPAPMQAQSGMSVERRMTAPSSGWPAGRRMAWRFYWWGERDVHVDLDILTHLQHAEHLAQP